MALGYLAGIPNGGLVRDSSDVKIGRVQETLFPLYFSLCNVQLFIMSNNMKTKGFPPQSFKLYTEIYQDYNLNLPYPCHFA